MSKWGFWDWVAYTVIFIAAAMLAADTGFKSSPTLMERIPTFFQSTWWGFTPLALVLAATVILLLRGFGFIGHSEPKQQFLFDKSPPSIVVAHKTFMNERIPLDGYIYSDCTFENVTFVYNGTRPTNFTGNRIVGRFRYATDNPSIDGAMAMLRGLGLLSNAVDFRAAPGSIVEFPRIQPGAPPSPPPTRP
jgi:hypothetical protein